MTSNLDAAIKIGEDLCDQLIAAHQELSDLKIAVAEAILLMREGRIDEARRMLEEAIHDRRGGREQRDDMRSGGEET